MVPKSLNKFGSRSIGGKRRFSVVVAIVWILCTVVALDVIYLSTVVDVLQSPPSSSTIVSRRASSLISSDVSIEKLRLRQTMKIRNSNMAPIQQDAEHSSTVQRSLGPSDHSASVIQGSSIAGLKCEKFGGPPENKSDEMVYWRDIPTDSDWIDPLSLPQSGPPKRRDETSKKYLTFEPDIGGFNNIRMSMETAVVLAKAMGRILVLPPEQDMYLLEQDKEDPTNNRFTFHDFFPLKDLASEHGSSLEIISMEDFLRQEALLGNLRDINTGEVTFPPNNATTWNGNVIKGREYWSWMRSATVTPPWSFDKCIVAIPKEAGPAGTERLRQLAEDIKSIGTKNYHSTRPLPVNASVMERLQEQLGGRKELCIYDDLLQEEKVLHFMGDSASPGAVRLLTHFYAYIFFEDYHHDLWAKRFVRDHLRYIDDIQCAAARVVDALRQKAMHHGDPSGMFDSLHIRRGDFQYKPVAKMSAEEIYNNTRDVLDEGSTVFVATDEKKAKFFDPLREHYHLYFLSDFKHLLRDLNPNFLGMVDQRIASRARAFVGASRSTFTGYINRMRGYHSQLEQLPGFELGEINSYHYAPLDHKYDMRKYASLKLPMWGREFPIGWRDIDHDLSIDVIRNERRTVRANQRITQQ